MAPDLHNARDFRDLLGEPAEQGPYVYENIFAADTWRERRRSRKKFTLLRRIDVALRRMLADGERVYFLTQGSLVTFREQFFLGWAMYYLNRRAVALTNRRILLLQISSGGRPRELRAQIDYRAIEEVTSTLFGNTRIRFRDGTTRTIAGVAKADRQFLRDRIARLREAVGDATPDHQDVEDLCPHCDRPPGDADLACEACGGRFKSPKQAALLSLVFPGAGDLYLGHKGFAALELVGAGLIWLGILALAWEPATSPLGLALTAGPVLLVIHGGDALGTRHIARTGLYPASGEGGLRGRFVAAAIVPVAVLAFAVVPLSGKRGLTPSGRVVLGDSLPERHLRALQDADYVRPGETLLQFYAAGRFSVLESGVVLTDRRVGVYGEDEINYERFFHTAPYEAIVDLQREPPAESPDLSVLVVAREDGEGFWFVLPVAGGQDLAFEEALTTGWRAARARRGEGVWYDGGAGGSAVDPIVVRGLAPGADPTDAERGWFTLWFGEEGTDWIWEERATVDRDGRRIDRVTVRSPTWERRTLFFEIGEAGEAR